MSFNEVWHHRLKYLLTPQLDLYVNVRKFVVDKRQQRKGFRVIDYGCGNGVGTAQLRLHENESWDVLGVDKDICAIDFCRSVFGHIAIFEEIDFADPREDVARFHNHKFNLLTCVEVIEHVEDYRKMMSNLRLSVSDHGLAIISTLNHNSQYRKNPGHVGRWKVPEFRELTAEYFPGSVITDYTLREELADDSQITPMVMVWDGRQ